MSVEVDAAVTVVRWLLTLMKVTNTHVATEEERAWQGRTCTVLQTVIQKAPSMALLNVYNGIVDCLLHLVTFAKQAKEIAALYNVLFETCSVMMRDVELSHNTRPIEHVVQSITSQLSVLTLYEYAL